MAGKKKSPKGKKGRERKAKKPKPSTKIKEIQDENTKPQSSIAILRKLSQKELMKRRFSIIEQAKKASDVLEIEKQHFFKELITGLGINSKVKFSQNIYFSNGDVKIDENGCKDTTSGEPTNQKTSSNKGGESIAPRKSILKVKNSSNEPNTIKYTI